MYSGSLRPLRWLSQHVDLVSGIVRRVAIPLLQPALPLDGDRGPRP